MDLELSSFGRDFRSGTQYWRTSRGRVETTSRDSGRQKVLRCNDTVADREEAAKARETSFEYDSGAWVTEVVDKFRGHHLSCRVSLGIAEMDSREIVGNATGLKGRGREELTEDVVDVQH